MKIYRFLLGLFLLVTGNVLYSQTVEDEREFRGAWLHTVNQNHFAQRDTDGNKAYLRSELDKLHRAGINAVIFQVRPCADAFYESAIEPWSSFLTGQSGTSPDPYWDPLEFMIEECHERGMELHAWLNPYRSVTVSEAVGSKHLTRTEPDRFVIFQKRYYFDPGMPENRILINQIVKDIVTRYDVDGIHMDDYFYPYPVKNEKFNDAKSYYRYGNGLNLGDWRRQNVNKLIEELSETIHSLKPWVRFGISPFGIWRNKSSDSRGSNTRGLQNYDDLYADVTMWAKNGWIDYQAPQLYWPMNHRVAPYSVLAPWWSENAYDRHVYLGQDVEKSMDFNELSTKIEYSRRLPNIHGNIWWPSVSVTKNYKNVADSLEANHQAYQVLPPSYPWLDDNNPSAVKVPYLSIAKGILYWDYDYDAFDDTCSSPAGVVIYKQDHRRNKSTIDNNDVLAIIRGERTSWIIPDSIERDTELYVRAFDRINRESESSNRVVYRGK